MSNISKLFLIAGKFKPLLDQLLELADKQKAFTDDEIRNHLDTIVLATFDTTAAALSFALLFLGTYQDVQERAYKEYVKMYQGYIIDINLIVF